MTLKTTICIALLSSIFGFIIGSFFLMIVAKIFKHQGDVFPPALKAIFYVSLLSFILTIIINSFVGFPIILSLILILGSIIFSMWMIKKFFKVSWGRAIGMWFVMLAFLIGIVLIILVISWISLADLLSSLGNIAIT